jgi:formate hydrogenlyase subunit 3/multisubunit Na+/H+ antiporter MnhD subunit
MRGVFAGLAGFLLAGMLLGATVGSLLPDDWSRDAVAAAGVLAALIAGAAAGAAGVWQGPPWTGIAGAALGALALIGVQPQFDAITAISLLAVLVGATAAALLSPGAGRRPGSRRGSARNPLRA